MPLLLGAQLPSARGDDARNIVGIWWLPRAYIRLTLYISAIYNNRGKLTRICFSLAMRQLGYLPLRWPPRDSCLHTSCFHPLLFDFRTADICSCRSCLLLTSWRCAYIHRECGHVCFIPWIHQFVICYIAAHNRVIWNTLQRLARKFIISRERERNTGVTNVTRRMNKWMRVCWTLKKAIRCDARRLRGDTYAYTYIYTLMCSLYAEKSREILRSVEARCAFAYLTLTGRYFRRASWAFLFAVE